MSELCDLSAVDLRRRIGTGEISPGEGAEFDLRLGGKTAPASGPPLDMRIKVIKIRENHAVESLGGSKRHMGDAVRLRAHGIDFIIHSSRGQNGNPAFFTDFDMDLSREGLLVVESMQHFHAAYAPVASKIIYTATDGRLIRGFTKFPVKLARPVWPLDADPWAGNGERSW